MPRRTGVRGAALSLGLCLLLSGCGAPPEGATTGTVARVGNGAAALPDSTWVRMVGSLSEVGGYFDTDNLISNEDSYLHPLGVLRDLGTSGGVYIGVGPDQNFSYMAEVRPRMAFLIDIRRDNLLQHLWFRALFTLAETRSEYLALMFGRDAGAPAERRPAIEDAPGPAAESPVALLAQLAALPSSEEAARDIRDRVRRTVASFGLPLSDEDLEMVDFIHRTFIEAGPSLKFSSFGRGSDWRYPSYRDLLLATDLEGRPGHYLTDPEDYAFLRRMQTENRVVPVVGDLAGDHPLREIADEVRRMGEVVSVLYTSSVEFYLFGSGDFGDFAGHVVALPRNSRSVIVRSFFRGAHPQRQPGFLSTQLVQRVEVFAEEWEAGNLASYRALVFTGNEDPG